MPQRYPVTKLADFPPGSKRAFDVGDRRVAVCNIEGKLYAIDDVCPHAGASMAAGPLRGTTLMCPWHSICFDVTSGSAVSPKNMEPLQSFPVYVEGDQVEVEI